MAIQGKRINELNQISVVSNETVLPAVYINAGTPNDTANKISIEQISNKIQSDLSPVLDTKQDVLTAGDNITIENNVISSTGGPIDLSTISGYDPLKIQNLKNLNSNIQWSDDYIISAWYNNQHGYNINSGLTISSNSYVRLFKNGRLIQPGLPLTYRHYTGGNNHSIYLTQVAPLNAADTWSISFRMMWTPGDSNYPCILAPSQPVDFQVPCICADSGKLGMFLSTSGTSWNLTDATQSSLTLPTQGTLFDMKLEFDGSSYQLLYSTNLGNNWSVIQSVNTTSHIICNEPWRFLYNTFYNPGYDYNNASTIFLENVKIVINGQNWFDGKTAIENTDFVNDNCILTEISGSTNDYNIDINSGIISLADYLLDDDITIEIISK